MLEFLAVGLGGFLGSCLRFALTKFSSHFAVSLPLGTLLSNVLAGLCIGFVIGLGQTVFAPAPKIKLFLTTGLCGGLSTFSTFSLETVNLLRDEKYIVALLHIFLNLSISILGVVIGMALAKLFKRA